MAFSGNKQKLLVEYLLSSPDTFALCKGIVLAEYFEPSLKQAVSYIHEYYDQYNTVPSPETVGVETGVILTKQTITSDQIEYCANEIEKFCKQRAIQHAILQSVELVENQDEDKRDYGKVEQLIRDAISISLNKDIGVEYFDDPLTRLETLENKTKRISTGWSDVDHLLDGGMAESEILLFSAVSGGGKSIVLANYGANMLKQGLDVLYISLELSEALISQRYDMMFTGIAPVKSKLFRNEIAQGIEKLAPHVGKLTIKHMNSGTKPSDIRAYLKEFELKRGYIPKVLIVDYLDLMGSNEKVSIDNVFEKDKKASEQLRDIGSDYGMIIATASQQNRTAAGSNDRHMGQIAGGMSKINTADVYIAIISDESMKAAGEIYFKFLKTRSSDGVGKTVHLGWDSKTLSVTSKGNRGKIDADGVIMDGVEKFKTTPSTNGYDNFFDT